MDINRNTYTREGIVFSSTRAIASSTEEAFITLAKNSSAGLQAVRQAEDGGYTAFWAIGPLCSQAPPAIHGTPLHHELMGPVRVLDRDGYYAYLSSKTWLKRSRSIKKAQGWRCACCDYHGPELQANHRHYNNLGGELPADLMAVCDDCHRRLHGIV